MNPYLLSGLIFGALAAIANVSRAISRKKEPQLIESVELIVATVGASGGVKIIGLVLTNQIAMALKASAIPFAEDDQLVIFVGCFALIWVSFSCIIRRLK